MIGDLFDSPWKIAIIAVLIIVLFGARKLPDAARSLGKSMRILKTEMQSMHEDDEPAQPAAVQAPVAAPAPIQSAATPAPATPPAPPPPGAAAAGGDQAPRARATAASTSATGRGATGSPTAAATDCRAANRWPHAPQPERCRATAGGRSPSQAALRASSSRWSSVMGLR